MAQLKREAGFTITELLIVAAILAFTMAAVVGIYQVTQKSTLFASAGEDAQLTTRAVLDRLTADLQLINSGRVTSLGAITNATASSITFLADFDNTLDAAGNLITVATCGSEPPYCAPANAGQVTVAAAPSTNLQALFPCGSSVTLADGPIMETHPLASCPSTPVTANTLTLAAGERLFTYYPGNSLVRSVNTVSYTWEPATGNLCRNVGGACPTPAASATLPPTSAFLDSQTIASGVKNFQLTYRDSTGATIPNPLPSPYPPPAGLTLTQTQLFAIRAISVSISVQSQTGDQIVSRTMSVSVRPRNLF